MGQPFPVTDGYVLIMEPAYHSPVGSASCGLSQLWAVEFAAWAREKYPVPRTRGFGGIVLEGLFSSLHVICV